MNRTLFELPVTVVTGERQGFMGPGVKRVYELTLSILFNYMYLAYNQRST